jgi:hypothetical protein
MQFISQSSYAQSLLDNNIVGGGGGTDSQVRAAVLKAVHNLITDETNMRGGPELDAIETDSPAKTLPAKVQELFAAQQQSSTSIVLLGESHDNAEDRKRAGNYLTAIGTATPTLTPTVIVLERGLKYVVPAGIHIVRETNLTTAKRAGVAEDFGLALTKSQRSMVVGGYLALCVASGNQQDINKILMFYGANHDDIFQHFDYCGRHTKGAYILKEVRQFFNIRSYV